MIKWSDYIRTVPDYPINGINFYDLNSLFAGPMFGTAIDNMAEQVNSYADNTTHIVGIESRGFVLGSAIAHELGLPFIMVRKAGAKYPGKLMEESYTLEYGEATLTLQEGLLGHTDRVVIVDDLVATGGSLMATKRLVEQTGATVLRGLTVVDLQYTRNHSDIDIPVSSLERVYTNGNP
tara:strand:- start:427 stop:963 length:537 start_codon:yes stop_codon:yes gene_type:complete